MSKIYSTNICGTKRIENRQNVKTLLTIKCRRKTSDVVCQNSRMSRNQKFLSHESWTNRPSRDTLHDQDPLISSFQRRARRIDFRSSQKYWKLENPMSQSKMSELERKLSTYDDTLEENMHHLLDGDVGARQKKAMIGMKNSVQGRQTLWIVQNSTSLIENFSWTATKEVDLFSELDHSQNYFIISEKRHKLRSTVNTSKNAFCLSNYQIGAREWRERNWLWHWLAGGMRKQWCKKYTGLSSVTKWRDSQENSCFLSSNFNTGLRLEMNATWQVQKKCPTPGNSGREGPELSVVELSVFTR